MAEKKEKTKSRVVVVRVRGLTGIKPDIIDTMRLMRLTRVNHCTILDNSPASLGMLNKCCQYVTWGEVSTPILAKLIEKRGRLSGDNRVTAAYLKSKGFDSFEAFADKFAHFEAELVPAGIKRVFRLNPPSGGYRSIKLRFPRGAYGPRGEKMEDLLKSMM